MPSQLWWEGCYLQPGTGNRGRTHLQEKFMFCFQADKGSTESLSCVFFSIAFSSKLFLCQSDIFWGVMLWTPSHAFFNYTIMFLIMCLLIIWNLYSIGAYYGWDPRNTLMQGLLHNLWYSVQSKNVKYPHSKSRKAVLLKYKTFPFLGSLLTCSVYLIFEILNY